MKKESFNINSYWTKLADKTVSKKKKLREFTGQLQPEAEERPILVWSNVFLSNSTFFFSFECWCILMPQTVWHNYHGYVRKWRPLAHCTGTGIGLHRAQILGPEKNLLQLVYYFISNPKERGRQGEAQTGRTRCAILGEFWNFENRCHNISSSWNTQP